MTLVCDKTGRWWRVRDMADARRKAVRLGLTCYTVCPDGTDPPTIRETTDEMRRNG